MKSYKATALLLVAISFILLITAITPTALATDHGSEICSKSAETYDTETVYVNNPLGAYIEIDGGQDTCAISVDSPNGINDLSEIEKAVIAVDYGGEVVIEEHTNFGSVDDVPPEGMMYEGAVIGTQASQGGVLADGKQLTIKGEQGGISIIRSKNDEIAPLVFADNKNEQVTVENLVLAEGERAVHIKSNSNVYLDGISVDGSIESVGSDDGHFLFEDSIIDSSSTGSILRTSENYYPDDASQQVTNVRDVSGNQIDVLEPNPSINVDNPSAFIFERESAPVDYNPVVDGNYYYSNPIKVDPSDPSADDEKIGTPFESLDAAMTAAGVRNADPDSSGQSVGGNVINVKDTGQSYDTSTIDGIGVSSEHSLSIVGTDGTPEISSVRFSHPGSYHLRNVEITEGVETNVPGVDLDASNVYWGITSGPSEIRAQRITSNPSSTVNISPWCTDADCSQSQFDQFTSQRCVLLEGVGPISQACENTDTDVEISISYDEPSGTTDLRTGTLTVEKREDVRGSAVEVDISVGQSSQDVDGSIRLPVGRQFDTIQIQSDFSPVRSRSTISGDIVFNPSITGSVTIEDDEDAQSIEFGRSLSEEIELTETTTTDDTSNIIDQSDGSGNGSGTVEDTQITGLVENQTTYVTSFNAGTSESAFEDNTIPPISINDAGYVQAAQGEMIDFGNARIENSRPATILPDDGWNVGFSIESLPPTRDQTLNIKYAYQAEEIEANNIDLSIVDSSNNVIYNSRPEDVETLEPTITPGVSDPYESGQSESVTETREVSIPLSELEKNYIRDTGNIYVTLDNGGYDDSAGDVIFLLYEMSISSSDSTNSSSSGSNSATDEEVPGSEPVPGDINVEVNVQDADFNDEYGTYDVRPESEILYELTFENLGDTAVTGTFDVEDTHDLESGAFVDNDSFNPNERYETTKMQEGVTVQLGTGEDSTITREYSANWDEEDFGRHEVRVRRTDIESDNTGNVGFDAYVLQQTTPKITSIELPDEHLTHDSVNAEVTVKNLGDLAGEITVDSEFGDWEAVDEISLPQGNTREGTRSDPVTVSYLRSNHPDTDSPLFTRREYTTPSEVLVDNGEFEITSVMFDETETHGNGDTVYYRPNAPFSTQSGETTFSSTVDSQINLGDRSNQVDSSSAHTDVETNTMTLGKLKIDDFLVHTNPTTGGSELSNKPTADQATVYASAWPYLHPSMSQMILTRPYADHNNPTLEGERTMFSYDSPDGQAVNRGSFPINHPDIGMTSQPESRYLSHSFSALNRKCNSELLRNDGASMVDLDSATSADAANTFVAFSATSCDDTNRITEIQPTNFVGTTTTGIDTDSRFPDSSVGSTDIVHPETWTLSGVNEKTFEDLDEDATVMMARVRMSNPIETQHITTARIEIVTNRTLPDSVVGLGGPSGTTVEVGSERFANNVVGAAAVRMQPNEEIEFNVPIVIRNNENVDGVHELSIRKRSTAEGTEDYLEFGTGSDDQSTVSESPITGEEYDRFTIPIKVESYGDAVLKEFSPADSMPTADADDPVDAQQADAVAYEVCRSETSDGRHDVSDSRANIEGSFDNKGLGLFGPDPIEGLNPTSGIEADNQGVVRDQGQCNDVTDEEETVTFEATYRNFGGDPIEIRPEMVAELKTRDYHTALYRQNAHATGDRFTADYDENNDGTEYGGKTWASITADGQDLTNGGTVQIDPDEEMTVTFERKFQEPGLYHLRVSPCRDITSEGPQNYNLEGFTGITDTYEFPSVSPSHWTTVRHGIDRLSDTVLGGSTTNEYSTPEMNNSVFHGSEGCAEESGSVFVFDSTNPVADFTIGHSSSSKKGEQAEGAVSDNERFEDTVATTEDQTTNNGVTASDGHSTGDPDFEVHEGGTLFLDSSSYTCPNCYLRKHFDVHNLETPAEDDTVFQSETSSNSAGLRSVLQKTDVGTGPSFSNRMSLDNARIAGAGTAGIDGESAYNGGSSDLTTGTVTQKGMEWTIGGEDPNFAQDNYCSQVASDLHTSGRVDEHCYMERFTGHNDNTETTPDWYELVPHRFTETGPQTVQLQVWDDPTLTEGSANTNTTQVTVDVQEDNEEPTVQVDKTLYNDLNYDANSDATNGSTSYHRENDIYQNIDYRGTPNNFDSAYDDTYEGTRMCMYVQQSSDSQIGVSQDAWWQITNGRQYIDTADSAYVTDDGNYVERTGELSSSTFSLNDGRDQIDLSETRDGDKRCWLWPEVGPSDQEDRDQTFEYQAWDFANNMNFDRETTHVVSDDTQPTIDTAQPQYESSVDDSSTANDFIWAYKSSTSSANGNQDYYRGGDVSFDGKATDAGVGVACLDLRLQRGTGLNDEESSMDIHSNCASMGDNTEGNPPETGIYGNTANNGAGYDGMGTDSAVSGYHNSQGWFSAYELSTDEYQYNGNPNSGGEYTTTETEELFAVDWHGNSNSQEIDVTVVHDETRPDIDDTSISCSGSSCSDHSISISSDGYTGDASGEGGTPIVDAELTSTGWNQKKDKSSSGDGCNAGTSNTNPSLSITSFPEGEHSGSVEISNSASVGSSAGCSCSCTSPSGGSCNTGSASSSIKYEVTFDLKITDAHGNTKEQSYSATVSSSSNDSGASDSCPDNPEPKDGGDGGGGGGGGE